MFKKHNTSTSDLKKSQQKCLDPKRDTPTRLKHLRTVLDNVDLPEVRVFLDTNCSPVFHVFYDAFILFESNLHQKGFSVQHRPHREDLEFALSVLERLLCSLPQLLARRWQCNALTHVFRKLLHFANTLRLRREGIRLFIIWYMIVGDNKTPDMDAMFASLVPGFPTPPPRAVLGSSSESSQVIPIDPLPLIPASSADKTPDDITAYLLSSVLDFMVSQVRRVEWRGGNKHAQCHAAFSYLFSMFRAVYLPYIFPNFNPNNSIYRPNLELPELRSSPGKSLYGTCQVVMVRWVKMYVSTTPSSSAAAASRPPPPAHQSSRSGDEDKRSGGGGDEGSTSDQDSVSSVYYVSDLSAGEDARLVREVLLSSRSNVDFIHELFRQALCLSFRYSEAIKTVILCYRDWIQMSGSDVPEFLKEPCESVSSSSDCTPEDEAPTILSTDRPIRSDSYHGAVREGDIRAGLQNTLQVFVTSAANVFLLQVSPDYPLLLDEQVEHCKHVLNTYRYMVMNTRMERKTWEQLLIVLFHITSQTLSGTHIKPKEDSLGGRFASALFQTLIVSWIKANLSVVISGELWDQLLSTLSSLSHWEELIKEWAKTLETLTRVLARHVYGLEVNNLPLDRVNERRAIKRGSRTNTSVRSTNTSAGFRGTNWSANKQQTEQQNTATHNRGGHSHPHHEEHPGNEPFTRKRMNSSGSSHRGRTAMSGGAGASHLSPDQMEHGAASDHHHHDICHHRHYHHYHPHQHHHNCTRRLVRALSDTNLVIKRDDQETLYENMMRSRSLSALQQLLGELSRSPSPSPSSGMESSSMKDSPMQLDFGGDTASIDTCEGVCSDQQSVMAGGSVRGWLPDVAVVLWKRVLGLLGDPTTVVSPTINAQIFSQLTDLTNTLVKLRDNQGISVDNQSTPEPPELVPPITLIAPWCFKALSLESPYQRSRLAAYRLLCTMFVRRHDVPPTKELLTAFYAALHDGLVGQDQEVISTLVGCCGPYFFSLQLPGATMLILDFIFAANSVVAAPEGKQGGVWPREEAISLLGSLLPLASLASTVPVLQPQPHTFTLMNCSEVKEHVLTVLLKSGKRDGYWRTRALALCALTSCLYHQLYEPPPHHRLSDAFNVLLASLKPPPTASQHRGYSNQALPSTSNNQIGRLVGQVAADLLLVLCDHSDTLMELYPDIPQRIIQVLCQTLSAIGGSGGIGSSSSAGCEDQHLILSIMFCLAEWVMKLPQEVLITPSQLDGIPLLRHVFKVLHIVSSGARGSTVLSKAPQIVIQDFSTAVREDSPRDSRSDTLKRAQAGLTPGVATTVRLAARTISQHLVNHLWHFPLGIGAQRLSSLVVESDDLPLLNGAPGEGNCGPTEELSSDVFLSPRVQLFAINHNCLLSMVQLPALHAPGGGVAGFVTPPSEVRLIMRDLSGKFSWDVSMLCAPPDDAAGPDATLHQYPSFEESTSAPSPVQELTAASHDLSVSRDDLMASSMMGLGGTAPRNMLRRRPQGDLPTHEDSAHDLDNLDDLLSYLGHTSPEVLEQLGSAALNESSCPPPSLPVNLQHDAITTTLNHKNYQHDYLNRNTNSINLQCPEEECPVANEEASPFQQCRLLFDQLGLASWDKRRAVHTLKKSDRLLRELKNLDNQKCRETHKIAVLYVAEGQEDKMSILGNSGGSERFEEFVGGLGWEVELSVHTGFLGGLHRNGSTGETAPYHATSLTEVIFHVSTRMPSHSEQSLLLKTRHLGNDEVHIVWSEHTRDYRRGIIPTEFCDVLLVIYPLPNRLHRIQISVKPDVPFFGPLFDGAMVGHRELPHLVRATAINASRAKRSRLPLYQNFYEERARALHTVIDQHSEYSTFENFISSVYCPVFPGSFPGGAARAPASGPRGGDNPHHAVSGSSSVFYPTESSSGLAAALLLDSGGCSVCGGGSATTQHGAPCHACQGSPHHYQSSRPPLTRPTSYSTGEQHNLREKARNLFHSESVSSSAGQRLAASSSAAAMATDGPSPRSAKKLSFKTPGRRVSSVVQQQQPSSTSLGTKVAPPPESPIPPPRRSKDQQQQAAPPLPPQQYRHSMQQQVIQQQQQHNRSK